MNETKPAPWTEHGKPVTRTFAKVSIADSPDERTGAPAGYTTIALSPAGWQDPELVRLLAGGGRHVFRAWVVRWVNGYPVREPAAERVCKHCWRPVFLRDGQEGEWDLVYREYEQTRYCDARGDGAALSSLPHEPWAEETAEE